MEKAGGSPKKKDDKKQDPKLSGVKIDGDKATGTVTAKEGDNEKSVKVNFEKVKGSWLLELPEEFFQQRKKEVRPARVGITPEEIVSL